MTYSQSELEKARAWASALVRLPYSEREMPRASITRLRAATSLFPVASPTLCCVTCGNTHVAKEPLRLYAVPDADESERLATNADEAAALGLFVLIDEKDKCVLGGEPCRPRSAEGAVASPARPAEWAQAGRVIGQAPVLTPNGGAPGPVSGRNARPDQAYPPGQARSRVQGSTSRAPATFARVSVVAEASALSTR